MTKNIDEQGPRVSEIYREVKARLQTAADADLEMSRKAKGWEKKVDVLEIELPKQQAILARMKKDCQGLQVTIRARDSKAAAEKEAELREAVKTGKMGVMEFHEKMSQHQRKTKTDAETIDKEISESIKATKAKHLETLKLKYELDEAKMNYYSLLGYPTETALGEMGKMLKEMSFRSQSIQAHYQTAMGEYSRAKHLLDLAKGQVLTSGWNRDGLSLADVQALVFDATIPENFMESLTVVIAEIEAYEVKRLGDNLGPAGKPLYIIQPGSYYLSCSFMANLTRPWTWLDRNSGKQHQMSQESPAVGLTMSNLPGQGKIVEV